MNETICPKCQKLIKWFITNNGLSICPNCNYCPTADSTILLGTSSNQPITKPKIPNK